MIELTAQQIQELKRRGWPPEARDPETGQTFVLIHREMFERVRAFLEAEDEIPEIEAMYPLVNEALEAEEQAPREGV